MAEYKIFAAYKANGRLVNHSDIVDANNRAEAEAKYKKEYSGLKSLRILNVMKHTSKGWEFLKK